MNLARNIKKRRNFVPTFFITLKVYKNILETKFLKKKKHLAEVPFSKTIPDSVEAAE